MPQPNALFRISVATFLRIKDPASIWRPAYAVAKQEKKAIGFNTV